MSIKKMGKHVIKKIILTTDYGRRAFFLREIRGKDIRMGKSKDNKWKYLFENIHRVHVYTGKDSGRAIGNMLKHIPIEVNKTDNFFYYIDEKSTWEHSFGLYGNTTVDYDRLLKESLSTIRLQGNDSYSTRNRIFIDALIQYVHRAVAMIRSSDNPQRELIEKTMLSMENRPAQSFYESIQRILFVNQILWQTGHMLNGLGNLDMLLYPYYKHDIDSGTLSRDQAYAYLKEFCTILHRNYEYKSACLLGDTGQIILLGGTDESGRYTYNELTHLFISVIQELSLPDPKILLKVAQDMPDSLLGEGVDCMATGIGSPLLANSDVIIPAMTKYGYQLDDARHYAVAACWEPLVPGSISDANNVRSLNYVEPLLQVLDDYNSQYDTFDILFDKYKSSLKSYVLGEVKDVEDTLKINEDVVMSTFMNDCDLRKKDITEGGARYNNIGFTGAGLGCAINSLINIRDYIFAKKKYTIDELKVALNNDFQKESEMQKTFQDNPRKYGRDMSDVIELTHSVIDTVNSVIEECRNPLGGRYKFGVSAPSYIDLGKITKATPDGRHAGQPFSPHISCADGVAYTELLQFAGKLDYTGCRFNGNVTDFSITPSFLKQNRDKFILFLKQSIKLGFFEMQMNVVDSKTLIAARKNPDAFPNLIVRVWGFSAYFKDLPDEYKDLLIERAVKAEMAA